MAVLSMSKQEFSRLAIEMAAPADPLPVRPQPMLIDPDGYRIEADYGPAET